MVYTTKIAEYLYGCGATNNEIEDFFYFCSTFKDGGKNACYEVTQTFPQKFKRLFMGCNKRTRCR